MDHLSLHLIYERGGGHTHVRVFAGKDALSRSKCGDLTFRNEEWAILFAGLLTSNLSEQDIDLDLEEVVEGTSHFVSVEIDRRGG